MKLGSLAYITLYSRHLEAMNNFCSALDFQLLHSDSFSSLFSDGNLYFDIRKSERDGTTLSYIVESDMPELVQMAENLGITILESSSGHCMLQEPNGCILSLFAHHLMPLSQLPQKPHSLCGTFANMSFETDNLEQATLWWQNVGFKKIEESQTQRVFDDGKMIVNFFQRGTFLRRLENPALVYRERLMSKRIASIQQQGKVPLQEVGAHAILEFPNGQLLFLLSES